MLKLESTTTTIGQLRSISFTFNDMFEYKNHFKTLACSSTWPCRAHEVLCKFARSLSGSACRCSYGSSGIFSIYYENKINWSANIAFSYMTIMTVGDLKIFDSSAFLVGQLWLKGSREFFPIMQRRQLKEPGRPDIWMHWSGRRMRPKEKRKSRTFFFLNEPVRDSANFY